MLLFLLFYAYAPTPLLLLLLLLLLFTLNSTGRVPLPSPKAASHRSAASGRRSCRRGRQASWSGTLQLSIMLGVQLQLRVGQLHIGTLHYTQQWASKALWQPFRCAWWWLWSTHQTVVWTQVGEHLWIHLWIQIGEQLLRIHLWIRLVSFCEYICEYCLVSICEYICEYRLVSSFCEYICEYRLVSICEYICEYRLVSSFCE